MSHLRWTKGGEADLVALEGDHVTLSSTTSSPPGSYVDGALVNDATAIRIKVRGCRRDGERYRIDGRILDASKTLRLQLGALVSSS